MPINEPLTNIKLHLNFAPSENVLTDSAELAIESLHGEAFNLKHYALSPHDAIRALHFQTLAKLKPENAPRLYLPPSSYAAAHFLTPNPRYEYGYADTQNILQQHLAMEMNDAAPDTFKGLIFSTANVHSQQLNTFVKALAFKKELGARTLLIPCYINSVQSENEGQVKNHETELIRAKATLQDASNLLIKAKYDEYGGLILQNMLRDYSKSLERYELILSKSNDAHVSTIKSRKVKTCLNT